MMLDLSQILLWGQATLATAFLVFLRTGAAMALLPAFGESIVPMRVRLALALAFTAIVTPAVAPQLKGQTMSALVYITEPVAGLALGLIFRLMVMALQIAGQIIAQAISLSQLLGVANAEPQSPVGHLLTYAGLALAVMSDLHLALAGALVSSYTVIPAGAIVPAMTLAEWFLSGVGFAFDLAVTMAMPFVIVSLLYNLALGVINKAMPQLMVAMVGAPAITAGGIALLAIASPILLSVWLSALNGVLIDPFGISR